MPGSKVRSRQGKETKSRQKSPKPEDVVNMLQHPMFPLQAFQPWSPSTFTVFRAILSIRLCASIWSNISDCDETYNYLEPMHYLLHGKGFQTWEYSPLYAIRSYAFIWLYAFPLKIYSFFLQPERIYEFYFLRILLAFVCSLCESYFYRSVKHQFGTNISRITFGILLGNAGMFISSTAVLPSSFAMYMIMLAFGGWFSQFYPLAIFGIAASAIAGWPFAGILGVPIAYDIVVRKGQLRLFISWSVFSAAVCLLPLVIIDSYYYGKLVIAPFNIVLYNVFSDHGPDIYGVEPLSFYFVNGILNFNVVFVLALFSILIVLMVEFVLRDTNVDIPGWLALSAMYLWMIIFFTRPHKEERFLFPIYPLICLSAAIATDGVQKLLNYLDQDRRLSQYVDRMSWLAFLLCAGAGLLSLSRMLALFQGYHAPLEVYGELHKMARDPHGYYVERGPVNLCVGKEWYRFPSSFFLPNDRWQLRFLKSQFRGQLPKAYVSGDNATRIIPTHMNDMNREEPTRYVDMDSCHFLVDLDLEEEAPYEPRFSQMRNKWSPAYASTFIHNAKSHRILRAFYIPYLSSSASVRANYTLLASTRLRKVAPLPES